MSAWAIAPSQSGLDLFTFRARGIPAPDSLVFGEGEPYVQGDGFTALVADTKTIEIRWERLGILQLLSLQALLSVAVSAISGTAWIRVNNPLDTSLRENWQDYEIALTLGNVEPMTRTGQAAIEQVTLRGWIQ